WAACRPAGAMGGAPERLPAVRRLRFPGAQAHRAAAGLAHAPPCCLGLPSVAGPRLSEGLPLVRGGAVLGGVSQRLARAAADHRRATASCRVSDGTARRVTKIHWFSCAKHPVALL